MSRGRDHDVAISPDVSPRGLSATSYLRKIAEALGCSVEDLIVGGQSLKQSGQVELLRLWSLLPNDAARMQVLELARTLAAAEGATATGGDGLQAGSRVPGE